MEFSRHEYWSGLPFPSPGGLPDPGIEPRSPTLQADTLPSESPGNLLYVTIVVIETSIEAVLANPHTCWDFASFPTFVLIGPGSSSTSHFVFNCHVCFVSFNL